MIREGVDKMIKNNTIKVILALIFAGALFFSCDINDSETGVLIINLPGSSARELQPYFIESLHYQVLFSGSYEKKETFSGKRASFILAPGKWDVTLNVLDVNDRIKGSSKPQEVKIRAGKHESISFNNIEITDLEGKNALSIKAESTAGFDIVHSETKSNHTNVLNWNNVKPINFKAGDKIKVSGRFNQNQSITISPLKFDTIINNGNFLINIDLTPNDIINIGKHNADNPNYPNGIRFLFGNNSEVIIEQLLITDKDNIIKLDFSDHLQTFVKSNITTETDFNNLFNKDRHLIQAWREGLTIVVKDW